MAEILGVYFIKNIKNNKVYVGSSKVLRARLRAHRYNLKANKHHNIKLQSAWNKYGESCFEFGVLEEVKSINLLIQTEQKWIDAFNASVLGYNVRSVAEANYGLKNSPEARLKISYANKGRVFSDERRKNISDSLKGYVKSQAAIEKQRAKIIGRKPSEQEKINKHLGMLGHKVSDECKRKISEAHKGRACSEEKKIKISLSLKGKKQPKEVIEKRKNSIKNMPPDKRAAYMEKLRITSTGRKRTQESITKGWETRRANQLKNQMVKEN